MRAKLDGGTNLRNPCTWRVLEALRLSTNSGASEAERQSAIEAVAQISGLRAESRICKWEELGAPWNTGYKDVGQDVRKAYSFSGGDNVSNNRLIIEGVPVSFDSPALSIDSLRESEPGGKHNTVLYLRRDPGPDYDQIVALRSQGYFPVVICPLSAEIGGITRDHRLIEKLLGQSARMRIASVETLVAEGEFAEARGVIADGGNAFFLAALKALGCIYPFEEGSLRRHDDDIAAFSLEAGALSRLGECLRSGKVMLDRFDPRDPFAKRDPVEELYAPFVQALKSSRSFRQKYVSKVREQHGLMVTHTKTLIAKALTPVDKVVLIFPTAHLPYDRKSVHEAMSKKGAKLVLVVSQEGTITSRRGGEQCNLVPLSPEFADLRTLGFGTDIVDGREVKIHWRDGSVYEVEMSFKVMESIVLPRFRLHFGC